MVLPTTALRIRAGCCCATESCSNSNHCSDTASHLQTVPNSSGAVRFPNAFSRTAVTRKRLSVVTDPKERKTMKTLASIFLIAVFAIPGCCLAQCVDGVCLVPRTRVTVTRPAPIRTFAANLPVRIEYQPSYVRVRYVAAPSYGCQGGGSNGNYSVFRTRTVVLRTRSHGCQGH